MTIEQFWNSASRLAVLCNTEEKADRLLEAFNKAGKTWHYGEEYLPCNNRWLINEVDTCYTNE